MNRKSLHSSTIGKKNYELSNHLGNVLTVISDKPAPPVNGTNVDYWTAGQNTNLSYTAGEIQVAATGIIARNISASKNFNSGISGLHRVTFKISNNSCFTSVLLPPSNSSTSIGVRISTASGLVIASGSYTTAGTYSFTFTTNTPAGTPYIISFFMNGANGCNFRIDDVVVSYDKSETKTVCNDVAEDYRFGFNGKEEDDELKGDGNSYTSLFRMLDPRLGRWLSTDPEENEFPEVSPYCLVDNNPIWKEDKNGDFWNYVLGTAVGGAVEYASQVASNVYSKGFSSKAFYDDVDFADVGAATIEGALTSGASAIKRTSTKIVVKAAIEITSEITKNAVDKKGGKSIKTNDAKSVIKNTAIGLVVNKVGDKAAGELGEKIIPKKAQLSVPNKKTGIKEARAKAAQNGNHLTTQQRKVIENKNIRNKAVNKHVNETIKKAPVNTVKGAGGNKAKEATH